MTEVEFGSQQFRQNFSSRQQQIRTTQETTQYRRNKRHKKRLVKGDISLNIHQQFR